MNTAKRTFNPLMGDTFRYSQSEFSNLIYTGNWGATIQPDTITSSTWSVEDGSATITNESNTTSTTQAQITGSVGESIIVNKVTTSAGEVEERKILLRIMANDLPKINNDYDVGW